MIRFAWLQSRTQTLVSAAAVTALAVVAAFTGVHLSRLYTELVLTCRGGCGPATSEFLSHDGFLQHALDLLSYLAPALLGVFWGAPLLSREFETGTYRLAWTQSVTRSRWLLTKLILVGIATAALAGALTLTITWWYRAIDVVSTNQYAVLDRRDITPIGYSLFAVAAGALIGAIIRRNLTAMATTLGIFVVARIAVTEWIRPHLLAPRHMMTPLLSASPIGISIHTASSVTLSAHGSGPPNSWTLSSHLVTAAGQTATSTSAAAFLHQHCPKIAALASPHSRAAQPPGPALVQACQAQVARTYHLAVDYLPADRYWTLQWLETGIFVGLALLAASGCYWWITHRAG